MYIWHAELEHVHWLDLGHGLEGQVIGHGFFGSKSELKKAYPTMHKGRIIHDVVERPWTRSKLTNTVLALEHI